MKKSRSGLIMLGIVVVLYGILYVMKPDVTLDALGASLKVLKMIIPILLIVFFIMALLGTFIDEKAISKHLGEESGGKGWLLALVGGILSHGPGYVWYPLLQNLREQGAKDGLVIAFIYARAIKIPWLPLMISYFGWAFTLVYTFYVVLGAYLQGVIVERLDDKEREQ
ncbi:permease [Sulfurovum lithotrophicum]|uniref:Permease n=1 Tax=Sulfurovum lithotrophicum TaxID=206403 RepID=A0A7U4RQS4_9BACT|nr:permease [Sulfurovum lithotrophicum]AKF25042.1 permease [Sulfurovum lithotrophicum]